MPMQAHKLPGQQLLIGGAAAVLLVGAAVAAMLLWVPEEASASIAAAPAGVVQEHRGTHVPLRCPECGVVTSAKRIGIAGPAAGGYAVIVRMRDGTQRSFTAADNSKWRTGDRMILIGGTDPRDE